MTSNNNLISSLPTQYEILQWANIHNDVIRCIEEIAEKIMNLRNLKKRGHVSFTSFTLSDVTIFAEFQSHLSGCRTEHFTIQFPVSYLWTVDYFEIENEAYQQEIALAQLVGLRSLHGAAISK